MSTLKSINIIHPSGSTNNIVNDEDIVRLTGPMINPNSPRIPVEADMPVGLEGVAIGPAPRAIDGRAPINVRWSNGRSLGLFIDTDKFLVISRYPVPEEVVQ
jgi:hypothetical protein